MTHPNPPSALYTPPEHTIVDPGPPPQPNPLSTGSPPGPIKAISAFTIFISFIYLLNSYKAMFVLLVLNYSLTKSGGLPYSFISFFPTLIYIPLFFAVLALVVFYSGLKLWSATKSSRLLLLIVILISTLAYFSFIIYVNQQSHQITKVATS